MKYFTINFLVIGTIWNAAFALPLYSCSEKSLVYKCPSSCKKNGHDVMVKVDQKSSGVLLKYTFADGEMHINKKENCKIFDDQNWQCERYNLNGTLSVYNLASMVSGRFLAISEYGSAIGYDSAYWCTR